MAAKKKEKKETKVEKKENTYKIPLRDAWGKHISKRSIGAVKVVREFLKKHTKSDNIKISTKINEFLMARGMSKSPRSVKVKTTTEEGKVTAELAE